MRRAISLLLVATLPVVSVSSVFAQNEEISVETVSTNDNVVTTVSETVTETTSDDSTTTLNAAVNTSAVNASSTRNGEYKEVSCSSDVVFSQNSCNQCFVGSTVSVGEKKADLFDNWKNQTTDTMFIAVKSEQKKPEMISFGSNWVASNADESKMWVYHTDVSEAFIPASNGNEELSLNPGQELRFYQSALGAGYTLESTTKNNGDVVGMMRFPVVYYTQDISGGERSTTSQTHYECVSYTLKKEETPPTPVTPKPPKDITKTETGPAETLVLIVAAFFIAFGLMISLRKRSN